MLHATSKWLMIYNYIKDIKFNAKLIDDLNQLEFQTFTNWFEWRFIFSFFFLLLILLLLFLSFKLVFFCIYSFKNFSIYIVCTNVEHLSIFWLVADCRQHLHWPGNHLAVNMNRKIKFLKFFKFHYAAIMQTVLKQSMFFLPCDLR